MVWRYGDGGTLTDKQDVELSTKAFPCGHQYHMRGWDDKEHSELFGHARYQWVVGSIHHEVVTVRKKCGKRGFFRYCRITSIKHTPNRDWDRVRVQFVKAMRTHCWRKRWKYHPGAHGTWQNQTNSGYIARISMRHRSEGCRGA